MPAFSTKQSSYVKKLKNRIKKKKDFPQHFVLSADIKLPNPFVYLLFFAYMFQIIKYTFNIR